MASPNIYSTGIGGTTGSELATATQLFASGVVWYVNSSDANASDAASPRGKERVRPLATLSQAYTNASAGDVISIGSGHAETLTSAQTLGKAGLTIAGEGSGSSRPRFTANGAIAMFDITAAGVTIDTIYFPASGTAPTCRVRTAAAFTRVLKCQFDCGANDTAAAMLTVTGAGTVTVADTTFKSTSTAIGSQPAAGLQVVNAITDLVLDSVTFDGGTVGWSNPFALDIDGAVTRLQAIDLDLLADSDVSIVTGTTGYISIGSRSGSARIEWAA